MLGIFVSQKMKYRLEILSGIESYLITLLLQIDTDLSANTYVLESSPY